MSGLPRVQFHRTTDLAQMRTQIAYHLREGYDLHGALVPDGDYLCQWTVLADAACEYKLVADRSIHTFEMEIVELTGRGWDFFQGTVSWNFFYLQWMCRPFDATLKDLSHLRVDQQLNLVTHVEKVGQFSAPELDIAGALRSLLGQVMEFQDETRQMVGRGHVVSSLPE